MSRIVLGPDDRAMVSEVLPSTEVDPFEEVWEGVSTVSPLPNDEHQDVTGLMYLSLMASVGLVGVGLVRPGVNVSDRDNEWRQNYRCPDVVVFLNGTTARNLGSHWVGGPDFLVEVISEYDRSREKLDFYAKINTREVLLIDRYPWALELYRPRDGRMILVGRSTEANSQVLKSEVLPLSFGLVAGEDRPRIEIVHDDGIQRWSA